MGISAVDLDAISFGPTPLAMLVVVVALAAVVALVAVAFSQVAGGVVDRRWPANEPLSPTEVLWGEAGGYVKKHFPGLDPDIARDLTPYLRTTREPAGAVIVEAGDLAAHFILVKSGAAEAVRGDEVTVVAAGSGVGADEIVTRRPFGYTLRMTAAGEVVRLPAEDYLAALALGMDDAADDDIVHLLAQQRSAGPAPAAPSAPPAAAPAVAVLPPPAPATGVAATTWSVATHRTSTEVPAFALPAGERPSRVLPRGTEVRVLEDLPGWAHVDTADGWRGWVESRHLVPASG